MEKMFRLGLCLLIAIILSHSVFAEEKLITSQFFKTKQMTNFVISPDGNAVLMSFAHPEMNLKEPEKSFWAETAQIYSLKDQKTQELSSSFYMPQWLADEKWLAYLAPGKEKLSLWVTPPDQLKPKKILELDQDIYAYKFSPDGKKLIIAVTTTLSGESDETRIIYSEKTQSYYIPYFYNVSDGFRVERFSPSLFSNEFPIYGEFNKPNSLFTWSPDNQTIAFLSQSQKEPSSQKTQLVIVNISNGKTLGTIDQGGSYISPTFSPDGKWLAYATDAFPGKSEVKIPIYDVGPSRVCLTNGETFEERCLAKTFNENPSIIGWTGDSQSVLVLEDYKTSNQFYKLGIDGKEALPLLKTANQVIIVANMNPKSPELMYIGSSFKKPQELYRLNLENSKIDQLTHIQLSSSQKDYSAEVIKWTSEDGTDIEGLLLLPEGLKANTKHPLLVLLHDGPAYAWKQNYLGDIWSPYLNIEALLEKGYAILAPNYRGSTGYGLNFRQANYKDLGGGDYKDVMSGIDHVIKQWSIDPERIAIWGWGYGGYLSAWAITQTNRFKTAIVGAGITDWISFVGETSNPESWEAYMGGYYWDNYDLWMSRSPSLNMQKVKTPTLIQWGFDDGLFHWVQAFELDYSLSDREVPHKLLWYVNEGHSFTNPYHLSQASKDLMAWIDKEMVKNNAPHDAKGDQK